MTSFQKCKNISKSPVDANVVRNVHLYLYKYFIALILIIILKYKILVCHA